MTGGDDKRDRDLFAHLRQVEERLTRIHREGLVLDPDRIMRALERETEYVHACVNELMADIESHPERHTDLNRLADLASRQLQTSIDFPVVVRTTADPTLPDLKYPHEAVLAAVSRALQLAAQHAGPGCEIQLVTRHDGSHAHLSIAATGEAPIQAPSLPLQLRCVSLSDLVQTIGGDIVLLEGQQSVSFDLSLAVDAPAR